MADRESRNRPHPPPPGPKNMAEWYIFSFDQMSFLGWFWILYLTVSEINNTGEYKHVFGLVWSALSYVQTAGLFEILHSLFGWTNAPVKATTVQVALRLMMVWGVNYMVPQANAHWSFSLMMVAWSTSECIRYSFYIFKLASGIPGVIAWIRYHSFYVLYPISVFSEIVLIYQALPFAKAIHPVYYYALAAASFIYLSGSYRLYCYMSKEHVELHEKDLLEDGLHGNIDNATTVD